MNDKFRSFLKIAVTTFIVLSLLCCLIVTVFPALVCTGLAMFMACSSNNAMVIFIVTLLTCLVLSVIVATMVNGIRDLREKKNS